MTELLSNYAQTLNNEQKEHFMEFLIQTTTAFRFVSEFNSFMKSQDWLLTEEGLEECETLTKELEDLIENLGAKWPRTFLSYILLIWVLTLLFVLFMLQYKY